MNTLIATSVGEEGLDIGSVDLIVSYDCLSSPVRMVQRLGRTGRAGRGKVIILIAQGEEEKKQINYTKNSQQIMKRLKMISKRKAEERAATLIKEINAKKPLTVQSKLFGFGSKSMPFAVGQGKTALEEIREAELLNSNDIQFYSFNPRMLPDNVHSRPILRKLRERPQHEMDELADWNKEKEKKIKAKTVNKRRSRSWGPSPQKAKKAKNKTKAANIHKLID